ncbi:MAG: hypothetical protein QMC67_05310 [Candidatus Wallbacteria bacterium]
MKYAYVRSLMIMHGIRLKAVANKINVTSSAVTQVLNGESESKKIKNTISEMLNIQYEKLWNEEKKAA